MGEPETAEPGNVRPLSEPDRGRPAGVAGRGRTTLRARLTAGTVLLCVLVLAAAGATIYTWTRAALHRSLDRALLSIASTEIASSLDGPDGRMHVHEVAPLLSLERETGYEKYAQIENAAGAIVARTANLRGRSPLSVDAAAKARAWEGTIAFGDAHLEGNEARGFDTGGQGFNLRALCYPLVAAGGQRLVAVVAIPEGPDERTMRSLLMALAIALLVGAGAAAWGAHALARHLTQPLEEIAISANAIGEGRLGARVPELWTDRELSEVAGVLNETFDRLEAAIGDRERMLGTQRQFIADASHELRSPLANLQGTLEVAMRRPRSAEEYSETLAAALTETRRLTRLVQDLLTLSRADTGQAALNRAPCDLADIARQSILAHRALAEERCVNVQQGADAPAVVCGDCDRLRQAADNLLDNALRYAPPATTVLVEIVPEPDRFWYRVWDSGPGLTEEAQSRVFDRFYRADGARARHSGGMGLGLAIVRAIALAHGGGVRVESAPGCGAAFSFWIPAGDRGGEIGYDEGG